jgi:hypothetical protein
MATEILTATSSPLFKHDEVLDHKAEVELVSETLPSAC